MSTIRDYATSSRERSEEEKKIEDGISLLVKREPEGKIIFKCWTYNEYAHYASKCPKRENKYKSNFKPRKPRECLYANDEDLEASVEIFRSESDNESDEIGFFSIKEESPKQEVIEERALVSQVENGAGAPHFWLERLKFGS